MKIPQDFRQKKGRASKALTPNDFIETLKVIRGAKDLDKIQELLMSVFQMYGLKTDEVAALLFSIMKNVLNQDHNKEFLKEKFSIDVTNLGENELDGIFMLQKTMLLAFYEKEFKDGKA